MENNNMEKIDQETLSAILKEHQLWLDSRGENGERADLSNKSLKLANLEGADLRKADLRRVNLEGADLLIADLAGANLEGANLAGANLAGANFHRANLAETNLEGAYLRETNLAGANLADAYLEDAYLEGVNLNTQLRWNSGLFTDKLQRKLQSSESTIQELEEKLKQTQQAQSETVKK